MLSLFVLVWLAVQLPIGLVFGRLIGCPQSAEPHCPAHPDPIGKLPAA